MLHLKLITPGNALTAMTLTELYFKQYSVMFSKPPFLYTWNFPRNCFWNKNLLHFQKAWVSVHRAWGHTQKEYWSFKLEETWEDIIACPWPTDCMLKPRIIMFLWKTTKISGRAKFMPNPSSCLFTISVLTLIFHLRNLKLGEVALSMATKWLVKIINLLMPSAGWDLRLWGYLLLMEEWYLQQWILAAASKHPVIDKRLLLHYFMSTRSCSNEDTSFIHSSTLGWR